MQHKLLETVYNLTIKRGKLILFLMAIITLAMAIFIPKLTISSSHQDLISKEHPDQARYLKFMEEFGTLDNLIVVLEGDTDTLKASADLFALEFQKEKKWVKSIFYKIETELLIKRALLYVPLDELRQGLTIVKQQQVIINSIPRLNNLISIIQNIQRSVNRPDVHIDIDAVPHLINGINVFFEEWNTWLTDPSHNRIKVLDKLFLPGSQAESMARGEGYLFSRDFKMLFLFIQPTSSRDEMDFLRPFMANIKKAEKRTFKRYPKLKGQVKVSYTGMPAHVLTENETIISDVGFAGSFSIVVCALILLIGFRSLKKVIIIVTPLLCGLIITLGISSLILGRLNLISSSFLAVLFGIGIDFGIYFIRRTEEELGYGNSLEESIHRSVVKTGRGVFIGGLTTGLAFYSISFSRFSGYSELGITAGTGIIVVLITTFLMIPSLIMLIKMEPGYIKLPEDDVCHKITPRRLKQIWIIIIPSIIFTIFSLVSVFFIKMNYNALDLLPKDTESTIYQKKMEKYSDYSMSSAAITTRDFQELRDIENKVKKLPEVGRVDSLASLIPDHQEEKMKVIAQYRRLLGGLRITHRFSNSTNAQYTMILDSLISFFEDAQEKAFSGGQKDLVKKIDELIANTKTIKEHFTGPNREFALARTRQFEHELFKDFSKMINMIHIWLNPKPVTEDMFPDRIINKFKSSKGTYVLYVFPNESIWDLDFLNRFVSKLKSISKEVTGFPVTHRVYIKQAANAIFESMLYALIIVVILLAFDFRKISSVALALIPLGIGMLWVQGVFFILGLSYNVANIAGLPLLLGLGVVYGVHIVHRWLEDQTISAHAAAVTTGKAVAFAAFTTISGLFSIVFARHQGASTFGKILLSGIILCLITALYVLPAIIDIVYLRKLKGEDNEK